MKAAALNVVGVPSENRLLPRETGFYEWVISVVPTLDEVDCPDVVCSVRESTSAVGEMDKVSDLMGELNGEVEVESDLPRRRGFFESVGCC